MWQLEKCWVNAACEGMACPWPENHATCQTPPLSPIYLPPACLVIISAGLTPTKSVTAQPQAPAVTKPSHHKTMGHKGMPAPSTNSEIIPN